MKIVALVAFLSISLIGCAATGMPSQEIVAGDITGTLSADTQVENVINQMTWWQFAAVCVLAGWAIPSPTETFGGIFKVFSGLFGGFITLIKTIKG